LPTAGTSARKDDHIRINLEEDVTFATTTTGLEDYRFVHQALPGIDLADVDPATHFLGHALSMPLLISSMTGGTVRAGEINRTLAAAAQEACIGMGLGSTRVILEHPELAWTFKVRDVAPDILLFANLGAVQLNYGYDVDACRRLVDVTQADALYLHLNPLQEAVQPEGDSRFAGLLRKIETVCRHLDVPVVVKEVGWGLSDGAARLLLSAGVSALDVAGAGGTSWSQVEYYRQTSASGREITAAFHEWGIPTEESIRMVRDVDVDIPLVASGGLKTGIDIAKCIALGADCGSLAGVMLRAAAESPEALRERIHIIRQQLTIAMFATGSATLGDLRAAELLVDRA